MMGLARINDGVTLSAEEILMLPEAEGMANVETSGTAFATPGAADTIFVRMDDPGRWAAVCFIPEGTTVDAEGTGPPHFTLGMVGEFAVT